MQLTFGFLSLLFVLPLAIANPVGVQTCGKGLQLQASQSQAPIAVTDMDLGEIAPRGRVQWVRCSGRSRKCVAKVKTGRRGWRAVWRLRSFKRGLLEGGEDDSEDDSEAFNGRSGKLILKSIKCDPASRPQVCSGRVRTGHTATWVAKIPPPYLGAPDVNMAEESLIDELEEMTAEGDFAEDEVLGMDDALEEDGDEAESGYDGEYEGDLADEAAGEDDEDSEELLEDALAPIRVRSLTCGRRGKVCKAALLSQGLVAKWNVRIRRRDW